MHPKLLIVILCFMSFGIKSFGQHADNIRFVHRGEELKPIGTLSVSFSKLIKPTDRDIDKIYGKVVKVDSNSLNLLAKLLSKNKYLTNEPRQLIDSDEFYEIVVELGKDVNKSYLCKQNFNVFFNDLRAQLKKNNMNAELIKAFQNY